jgi:hypothetical protein
MILRLEHVVHCEAQAYAPQSERRPRAVRARETSLQLRLAHIERANRDPSRRHAVDQTRVGHILRLF